MSAVKRIAKEYAELIENPLAAYRNLQADESNMFLWSGLLVPDKAPYNKGAYKFIIEFPDKYPFKPPKVVFKTRMYHPNIDKDGNICMGLLKQDAWKPATKVVQILESLANLIDEPNPSDPLDTEIAEIYTQDNKKFMKNAEDHIKKHSEKRPK
eukprot:comp22347_c0_seq1/m.33255 comp22347_c0_seq1/g.33255  ORF comp22347_c0_seq1/g.33255 comp22347_c0_seq1/m.33255 type:complete len:154 (-) comp22347_c0_seq1:462-923(-)